MTKAKDEFRPIILIWPGNSPLTVAEKILLDELIDLYGYRNVRQFLSVAQVEQYLARHSGMRYAQPGMIAVYSPEVQEELQLFFFDQQFYTQKKLLAMVSRECVAPPENMGNDDFVILTQLSQESLRETLIDIFGQPVKDHQDPVALAVGH